MKEIKKLVNHIEEELHDAKCYAEKYLDAKAHGNPNQAAWHKMAEDELHHSNLIHDIAVEEIQILKKVYTPTTEMEAMWKESHQKFIEKSAWIHKMLNM